ncbi:MAG: ribonuclease H-like domain-containing protein [Candidatus Acidiferrales bacterium]
MPTLRQRLEGLTAARPALRPAAAVCPARSGPGFAVSESFFPLTARKGLARLPLADPQLFALLLPDSQGRIPPIRDWLFLDLETTGLTGGTGTYAFLVGLGRLSDDGFHLRQYFLRDLAAEAEMLAAILPLLCEAQALVTYNGKQFDAPLLETRFRLARASPPAALLHLDLLYPARQLWRHRWDSLRLVDLERNLVGFHRHDDIPGELIPSTYFDFLRRGEEGRLSLVFRHNADDLLTLAAVGAHALELLAAPESATGVELISLARIFERARQLDRARVLYEQALVSGLPPALSGAAGYRLSLLYKRQKDYERAVALWQQLLESSEEYETTGKLALCEELAICYEHRLDDPETAAELTRRAQALLERNGHRGMDGQGKFKGIRARFSRRLARLTRKQSRASATGLF